MSEGLNTIRKSTRALALVSVLFGAVGLVFFLGGFWASAPNIGMIDTGILFLLATGLFTIPSTFFTPSEKILFAGGKPEGMSDDLYEMRCRVRIDFAKLKWLTHMLFWIGFTVAVLSTAQIMLTGLLMAWPVPVFLMIFVLIPFGIIHTRNRKKLDTDMRALDEYTKKADEKPH